ncbi:agamous-like MADS-box protein AGL80 [Lathyrus oleraceus]|uniref:agamous-like MADS-box protein AGL80 n=1 Tax=Pisum sativum TaxID=3888 RepID=UPI001FC45FE0|nr:agamous-like MADS-box protein AGL80 [Pisum sativum]
MGRAKIKMKFIENQKARKIAFIQRQKGLIKKVSEFSRKFGVEACLVMYDGDDGNVRPIIWPQDSTIVHTLLKKYEQQKIETTPKKFDMSDYFANRKIMVEAEIFKLRKKIVINKYPTWSSCFHTMDVEQLKDFVGIVDVKIQTCNHKINMLKNMQQTEKNSLMQNKTQENVASSLPSQLDVTNSIPQMQHISDDPMVSSTNQINEPPKIDDRMVESHQEWANQLDEFLQLDDPVAKPENQTSDLANFEEWANQLNGDIVNWNNQPDLYAWQDISFMP